MIIRPTRRAVVLGAAGVPFALRGAVSAADNWLLTDRHEIEAAKVKAGKSAWAKGALDDVMRSSRQSLSSKVDLPDRGGKYRDDLYFLNNTDEPAILIEVCFVDSSVDADHYRRAFSVLCSVIADRLGGTATEEVPVNPTPVPPEPGVTPRVDIKVTGEVLIFVNGEQVGTKG